MTVDQIMQLISGVGFPIVMCGALFWYMIKMEKKHTKDIVMLRASLDNNTLILSKLYDRLTNDKSN